MRHKELGILKNMRKRLNCSPSFAARIKQNTIQYVTPNWFWVTSGKVVWKGLAAGMAFTISNNACESFLKPLLRSFLGGIGSRRQNYWILLKKMCLLTTLMPLEQAKGIIGKAPVSSSQKANFTVTDVGDDLYQIVHSKYSCVANMCKKSMFLPWFLLCR